MRKINDKSKLRLRSDKGFTLVELLIVLMISSIILTAVITVFSHYTKSDSFQKASVEAQHETRTPMEFMARSIRMAGLDPMNAAGAGILQASSSTLQITADLEVDGDVTGSDENITYSWSGTPGDPLIYTENTTGTSDVLADNVTSLTFEYFDSNNAALTPLPLNPPSGASPSTDDIASIRVTMTVSVPAGRSKNVTQTISNIVRCRNINI